MQKYFPINGMTHLEYLESINNWLCENPGIVPVRLCVGEFTESCCEDKREAFELTLVYETGGGTGCRYALSYYHKISSVKIGLDVMKDFWQEANPQVEIVLCSFLHSVNRQDESAFDEDGNLVPNCNRLWILYKKCDDVLELTPAEFYREEKDKQQTQSNVQAQNDESNKTAQEPNPTAESPVTAGCFCVFCGKKSEAPDAVFCPYCGKKLIH